MPKHIPTNEEIDNDRLYDVVENWPYGHTNEIGPVKGLITALDEADRRIHGSDGDVYCQIFDRETHEEVWCGGKGFFQDGITYRLSRRDLESIIGVRAMLIGPIELAKLNSVFADVLSELGVWDVVKTLLEDRYGTG